MSTTFASRVIEGDIHKGNTPKAQDPESEFTTALNDVLNNDLIEAVRWRQYTPYFNDGDPCVFGAHSVYFQLSEAGMLAARLTGQNTEGGDYDDGFLSSYDLTKFPNQNLLKAFEKAVEGGSHYVLLAEKFGDHAIVTATKEKFIVDYYEHD